MTQCRDKETDKHKNRQKHNPQEPCDLYFFPQISQTKSTLTWFSLFFLVLGSLVMVLTRHGKDSHEMAIGQSGTFHRKAKDNN